jgi:hypothetical protein
VAWTQMLPLPTAMLTANYTANLKVMDEPNQSDEDVDINDKLLLECPLKMMVFMMQALMN